MTPFYRKLMDLESQRLAYSFHVDGIRMFFVFWGEFFGVWKFTTRKTHWMPMPMDIDGLSRLCSGISWKRTVRGGAGVPRTPEARAPMVVRAMQKELRVKSFAHLSAWAMGLQDEWETMNPHARSRLNMIVGGTAKHWGSKRRAKFVRLYITRGEKEAFRRVFPNMNPALRNSYREAAVVGAATDFSDAKWFYDRFRGPTTCKIPATWDQVFVAVRIANNYGDQAQATFQLVCRWLVKNPTQRPGLVHMKAQEIYQEGLALDWQTMTVQQLETQYQAAQEQRRARRVNFQWALGFSPEEMKAKREAEDARHLEAIKHFANLPGIGREVRLLTTQAEYQAEGHEMGHCVGTYWMHRVHTTRYGMLYVQVWSIEVQGERATLSLYFNDKHELIEGGQLFGPKNKPVSDLILEWVKGLCIVNNWPLNIIRKGMM
jgi:hypothetical protein